MSDLQRPTGDDDKNKDAVPTPDAASNAPVAGATPAADDAAAGSKKRNLPITTNRIVLWVVVGGIALYLIISGVVGIIAKGQ
jgi:hypothetical protein